MICRKAVIFAIVVLMLSACSNAKKKIDIDNDKIIEQDLSWIDIELKKQLSIINTNDSIDIYGLPIEEVPNLIYRYNSIKYLRISCTEFDCIKSISNRIAEFKYLETLIISKSALTNLPKEIGNLRSLKKLSVAGGGRLESIPNEISNLKNLESLDLWRNNLSEISFNLTEFENLKSINLGENRFSKKYMQELKQTYPQIEIKTDR